MEILKVLDIILDIRERAEDLIKDRESLDLDTFEEIQAFTDLSRKVGKMKLVEQYLLEIYSQDLQSVRLDPSG